MSNGIWPTRIVEVTLPDFASITETEAAPPLTVQRVLPSKLVLIATGSLPTVIFLVATDSVARSTTTSRLRLDLITHAVLPPFEKAAAVHRMRRCRQRECLASQA